MTMEGKGGRPGAGCPYRERNEKGRPEPSDRGGRRRGVRGRVGRRGRCRLQGVAGP